ncbi:GumC family protein [Nitratireductor sp. GISD-1A_MAKvit]|uniref:GumC family protein n=1 Tax=Nitratireductor sp. GISD-1A_MAKvit TaxID=3234198 RepID=UPI0034669E1F
MFDADNPKRKPSGNRGHARSLLSMQSPQDESPSRTGRNTSLLAHSSPESEPRDTRRERAASAQAYLQRAEAGPRNGEKPVTRDRRKPMRGAGAARPETSAASERTPIHKRILDRLFPLPEPAGEGRRTERPPAARAAYARPHQRAVPPQMEDDEPQPPRTRRRPAHTQAHARTAAGRADDRLWRPLIDPVRVIGGIFRAKWLILLTTIIGAVLGVMTALSTPKEYYAATQLIFDPRNLQLVERDLTPGGLPSDATLALIENQVAIITSGNVLARVVDELDLADDPEFNGTAGGSVLGLLLSPRALVSALVNGGGESDGSSARHSIAVDNLADALDVGRNAKTFIITIGATTEDPEKSALIATTTRDVFLSTFGELQSATAGRANREIIEQLKSLRAEVEQAERAVADFKAKNDIVDAQGRLITDDEIVRLSEQLSAARARTSELNARAAAARSLDVETVLGGALPEQIASPVMTELLAQYSSLKQQAGRLAVRLGSRHPDRLSVEAELAGARDEIARELRRVVASNQVELQRAVQLEQDLAAQLARLKVQKGELEGERVTLRELEREANAKRSVYESLLLRARETGQQERLNNANVSVISQAVPPLDPTGPSRSSIAMAGMILGFVFGVGIGAAGGAIQSLRENMAARQADEDGGDEGDHGVDADPEPDPTPPEGGRRWREADEGGYRHAAWRERPHDRTARTSERHAHAHAPTDWENEDEFRHALEGEEGLEPAEPFEELAEERHPPQPSAPPTQPGWPAGQVMVHPGMMPFMPPMQQAVGMPMMQPYPIWQQAPAPTQSGFPFTPQQAPVGQQHTPEHVAREEFGAERFADIHDRLKAVRREIDALTARRSNRHRY